MQLSEGTRPSSSGSPRSTERRAGGARAQQRESLRSVAGALVGIGAFALVLILLPWAVSI
jgi:hypothetical protein